MRAVVRRSTVFALLVVVVFTVAGSLPVASAQNPTSAPGRLALIKAGLAHNPSLVPPRPKPRPGTQPDAMTSNVTYTGFTPQARTAFQYAVDIWEAQLTSSVPIEVEAFWEPLEPGALGAAGPTEFRWNFGAGRPNVAYPVALANKLAGRDLNPAEFDISTVFNSEFDNWYFGTDGNTPPGTYDFVTVVLHELGHGLGFIGSMSVLYPNNIGSWGFGDPYPFVYDIFAEDGDGNSLINTSVYPNPSLALALILVSNELVFDSPASRAANGGTPPKLYAPEGVFFQGTSFTHLDEDAYPPGDPDSLMTPYVDQAEAVHDPGAITRGIFADIGWTGQSPPPPEFTETVFLPLIRR